MLRAEPPYVRARWSASLLMAGRPGLASMAARSGSLADLLDVAQRAAGGLAGPDAFG